MRVNNWQVVFEATVKANQTKKFAYGTHDCCLWAANCAKALTGVDYAEPWRGKYTDKVSADAFVKAGGGLEAMVTSTTKIQPLNPLYANVGDIVLAVSNATEMLGICNGDSFLAPSATKLVAMPMSLATKVWKI